MGKSFKIILPYVCVAFVFALLGFGLGRMTDTAPAIGNDQNFNTNQGESETTERISRFDLEAMEAENEGVEVRFQDGSVWKVIVDPSLQSVIGNDFDWGQYDIWMAGGHD